MKFQAEIEIDLPINDVLELFQDPDNLFNWQPKLKSYRTIKGESGQVGAKSKLHYQIGNREIEMTETILPATSPRDVNRLFKTKGISNKLTSKFMPIGANRTRWIAQNDFHFNGIMSVMSLFKKEDFKSLINAYLKKFKEFAEQKSLVTV